MFFWFKKAKTVKTAIVMIDVSSGYCNSATFISLCCFVQCNNRCF